MLSLDPPFATTKPRLTASVIKLLEDVPHLRLSLFTHFIVRAETKRYGFCKISRSRSLPARQPAHGNGSQEYHKRTALGSEG